MNPPGAAGRSGRAVWTVDVATIARLVVAWLAAVLIPALAFGQAGPVGGVGGGGGGVRIDLAQAGVGGKVREGSWAGFQFRLTDSGVSSRDVLVRLSVRDSDGDIPAFTRKVTLNPGVSVPVWLYARVPGSFELSGRQFVATVHTAEDDGLERARRGVLSDPIASLSLGDTKSVRPLQTTDARVSLMLRAGLRPLGLTGYQSGARANRAPLLGHERVEIAELRSLAELPDSWLGLEPYDVVVIGSGEPTEVRGSSARALREWVRRGGHLVVVLPPAGQNWVGQAAHELTDVMPAVSVSRREGVDLSAYAPLLTRDRRAVLPTDAVVHTFTARPAAEAGAAVRVMEGPAGECVVARRVLGGGMVTVVGIDLSQRSVFEAGSFHADVFWHRVLGRRGQLPTAQELADISSQPGATLDRPEVVLDRMIAREIATSGRAVAGIFLGFVVFGLYWVVAGPGVYFVLKRYGRTDLSWLGYIGSAGVFTAIAWGGAALIRPAKLEAVHLSTFEQVFGDDLARTRTWASLMIPWYGTAEIALGNARGGAEPDASFAAPRNALAPWDDPDPRTAASDRAFPDTREYTVDAERPDMLPAPARSTVKLVQAEWMGSSPWRTPYPVTADGQPGGELTVDASGRVSGRVRHELPSALTNVVILYVQGQRAFPARAESTDGAASPAVVYCAEQTSPWLPGQELDVGRALAQVASTGRASIDDFTESLVARNQYIDRLGGVVDGSTPSNLRSLALITQLAVPVSSNLGGTGQIIAAQRTASHRWDLGKWFTQPCVIILGDVQDGPSPTPFFVDGRPVPATGRTSLRWVYPLAERPPGFGGPPVLIRSRGESPPAR